MLLSSWEIMIGFRISELSISFRYVLCCRCFLVRGGRIERHLEPRYVLALSHQLPHSITTFERHTQWEKKNLQISG
jgi:hypothetical protein